MATKVVKDVRIQIRVDDETGQITVNMRDNISEEEHGFLGITVQNWPLERTSFMELMEVFSNPVYARAFSEMDNKYKMWLYDLLKGKI